MNETDKEWCVGVGVAAVFRMLACLLSTRCPLCGRVSPWVLVRRVCWVQQVPEHHAHDRQVPVQPGRQHGVWPPEVRHHGTVPDVPVQWGGGRGWGRGHLRPRPPQAHVGCVAWASALGCFLELQPGCGVPPREPLSLRAPPVCVALHVSPSLCLPLCVSLYVSLYMCLPVCVALHVSPYMCLPTCVALSVSPYMCLPLYVCVYQATLWTARPR